MSPTPPVALTTTPPTAYWASNRTESTLFPHIIRRSKLPDRPPHVHLPLVLSRNGPLERLYPSLESGEPCPQIRGFCLGRFRTLFEHLQFVRHVCVPISGSVPSGCHPLLACVTHPLHESLAWRIHRSW